MKRAIGRFLLYFVVWFFLIMLFGVIFKPSDIVFEGIVRALVISSASAFAMVFVERLTAKK
ncbi:hypothetical protein [Gracilibacillus sp. YIM 98692]|uniref:hypothetical protein n=1 Tax=Gracilibacillus sp. YIM 98692 TaxID=2663532 RepID=UPI0013D537C1|nr:hypothetical protein [Gracilibacillus sp. YIM 98692]